MALIKEVLDQAGWASQFFSIETPPSELGPASAIKTIWDKKRSGTEIPSWREFGYEDFTGYHGWVAVEDILSVDPYDSVFRLWGTNLVDVFNVDLTGKKASNYKDLIYTETDFELWKEAVQLKAILISKGTMNWVESFHYLFNKKFIDITLPLSDDGMTITKFMNVTLLQENS